MILHSDKAEKILALIGDENYRPMRAKDIGFLMGVPNEEMAVFQDILNQLIEKGSVIVTKKGKIMKPEKLNLFPGVFIGNSRGFGFVTLDEGDRRDIFIPAASVNGAMHMDRVLCRILQEGDVYPGHPGPSAQEGPAKRAEGEIVRIVEKGLDTIVGTFIKERGYRFVTPDETKIPQDILIREGNTMGAVSGHKVVVKLLAPPHGGRSREGRVIEILGHKNDPGVDVLSIVRMYKIPEEFPQDALKESEEIPCEVSGQDTAGRRDLRAILTITIDGEDTKDIDDAISLSITENGSYLLGVHIADVTHYVIENGALDREALKRGTSVYLADRVIPMLPHKLSNGICSLNAGEDRLALSCIMEINPHGRLIGHEITTSVVHVDRQMTYTLVNALLSCEVSDGIIQEYSEYMPMLRNMKRLSAILRDKREKRGAIEFELPEAKIIVDEAGMPVEIRLHERNTATGIIEEFMLMCNETVAEEYFYRELPFVYRTHEEPDAEKMLRLSDFIHNFGFHIKGKAVHPKALQDLLSRIRNSPEETIISRVMLRSMKQARYTVTNDGHFGLAAKNYCHFTSPIRRYPDLQIHRIIKENLSGIDEERIQHYSGILPAICSRCSLTERTADEAEREVENLKKVQFMKDKLGQSFDGIISGMTSWGIYVELPNTVEGMISLENMDDDYYIFLEDRMTYVGEHTRKAYRLGQAVRVVLIRANEEIRKLDFIFEEDE